MQLVSRRGHYESLMCILLLCPSFFLYLSASRVCPLTFYSLALLYSFFEKQLAIYSIQFDLFSIVKHRNIISRNVTSPGRDLTVERNPIVPTSSKRLVTEERENVFLTGRNLEQVQTWGRQPSSLDVHFKNITCIHVVNEGWHIFKTHTVKHLRIKQTVIISRLNYVNITVSAYIFTGWLFVYVHIWYIQLTPRAFPLYFIIPTQKRQTFYLCWIYLFRGATFGSLQTLRCTLQMQCDFSRHTTPSSGLLSLSPKYYSILQCHHWCNSACNFFFCGLFRKEALRFYFTTASQKYTHFDSPAIT